MNIIKNKENTLEDDMEQLFTALVSAHEVILESNINRDKLLQLHDNTLKMYFWILVALGGLNIFVCTLLMNKGIL